MDFNDTPDQAKFRAKCKEWLDSNAKLKDAGKRLNVESNLEELIAKAKVWQLILPGYFLRLNVCLHLSA